jgi:hypothetical protein
MEKKNKEKEQFNKVEKLPQLPQQKYGIRDFIRETGELLEMLSDALLVILLIILPFAGIAWSIWWISTKCTDGINGFWDIAAIVVLILSVSILGAAASS